MSDDIGTVVSEAEIIQMAGGRQEAADAGLLDLPLGPGSAAPSREAGAIEDGARLRVPYSILTTLRAAGEDVSIIEVQLTNGASTGWVRGSKVSKWLNLGFEPVE